MVNRGDAVGNDEWRELPIEQQMAFKISIDKMLNVTLLREIQPVVLVSEFLRLHGLSPDDELSDGTWNRETYHSKVNMVTGQSPTLYRMENHWYDPTGSLRVDALPSRVKDQGNWYLDDGDETGPVGRWASEESEDPLTKHLSVALGANRLWLEWEEVREVLRAGTALNLWNYDPAQSDEAVEELLTDSTWVVLHTFQKP